MDAILIEKNILQDERNILQAEKEDLQKRYLAECSLSKSLKQSLSAALDLSQNSDLEIGEPGSMIPHHGEATQLLSKSHSSQDLGSANSVKDESSTEVALRAALEDGKYGDTSTCCVWPISVHLCHIHADALMMYSTYNYSHSCMIHRQLEA